MRLSIAKDVKRLPSSWEAFSLLMLAGAGLYFPFWLTGQLDIPLASPLRWLGFACPLCGGTRAVGSLVLGHLGTAVRYNPLALLLFAAMIWGACSYLFLVLPLRRRVVLEATKPQLRLMWTTISLLFVANWAYVLYAGMYLVPLSQA
jgi:hypothetical protein